MELFVEHPRTPLTKMLSEDGTSFKIVASQEALQFSFPEYFKDSQ